MKMSALVTAVAATLVFAASDSSAKVRENFEQVVPFSPGGSFEIENKNGSIHIETWNEDSVRIEATKKAKSEEHLDDIEIVIDGSGSSVSVETVHHRRRDGGQVSYEITLPEDANVHVSTANGTVTIEGIHGHVVARSVNGSLKVEDIVGEIEASTTNGSIRARYDEATDGRHSFETTNGSVRVYLPSDAGGDFEANTVNGSIDIDFPTHQPHARQPPPHARKLRQRKRLLRDRDRQRVREDFVALASPVISHGRQSSVIRHRFDSTLANAVAAAQHSPWVGMGETIVLNWGALRVSTVRIERMTGDG